jgi:hypothetical protein
MAAALGAGLRIFTGVLLTSALLSACGGGGDLHSSNLLSGTAAVGAPLVDAEVHLRCADGSVFQTSTNASGLWQLIVSGQPLPCALQAKNGSLDGLPNATAYHSVALSYGVNNITPLTDLILARTLAASPQAWFDKPDFAGVTPSALQSALASVRSALGLSAALRQANPLTEPFIVDGNDYLFRVLDALQSTLVHPAVSTSYPQLLDAVIAGNLETAFPAFAATFAAEMLRLYPD